MAHRHLLHTKTVEELRELTLSVLADGGFADKRTELEAWCDAYTAAVRRTALLEVAHEKLKALGFPRGVLDLAIPDGAP